MLLGKEHKNQEENKLVFVLSYCPVFQNIKTILVEEILIPSDKRHFVMFLLQHFVKEISKFKLVRTSFPALKNRDDPSG